MGSRLRLLFATLAALTISSVSTLGAEEDGLRFVRMETGALPTNDVSKLYQDSEGYVWIVSYYGLVRYDGYDYVNFSLPPYSEESFEGYLHTICEGADGNLYVGTERGMLVVDKKESTLRRVNNILVNQLNILNIVRDTAGRLWLSSKSGLYRMDSAENVQKIDFQRDPSVGDISGGAINLLVDPDNNLWITTWENGLYRYDLSSGMTYHYNSGEFKYAYSLYLSSDDTMWIGTWGHGLLEAKRSELLTGTQEFKIYVSDPVDNSSIIDNIIYDIEEDADGTLYIGTRSGLSVMDKTARGRFHNIYPGNREDSIPFNEVNSLLCTEDNVVMLGMMGGGVCRIGKQNSTDLDFISLDKIRDAYKTSSVKSIFWDADKSEMWLSLYGYGVVNFNVSTGRAFSCRDLPCFNDCRDVTFIQDIVRRRHDGKLCFGTFDDGLWLFDPGRQKLSIINSTTRVGLLSDCVISICEDTTGNIFFGTDNGIFVLDTLEEVRPLSDFLGFKVPDSGERIQDISIDSDGTLWFASGYAGIFKVSITSRENKIYQSDVPSWERQFGTIFCDSAGNVWAGSMWQGLYLYNSDKDSFDKIGSLPFMQGEAIYNICENPAGTVWVTTDDCVTAFKYDDAASPEVLVFRSLPTYNSIVRFNRNACAPTDSSGTIAIGCSNGLSMLSCKDMNSGKCRVGITGLRVNDQVKTGSKYSGRVHGHVSVTFSNFDYTGGDRAIYKYRLTRRGSENGTWSTKANGDNEARFSGLRPGRYTFEVCAKPTDSMEYSDISAMDIRIKGNPFLSGWAWATYALLAAFSIGGLCLLWRRYRLYRGKLAEFQEDRDRLRGIDEIDRHIILKVKDINYTSSNEEFLRKAMDVVNTNIENQEFTQEDFAREMGMSKTALMVRFKELVGMSPIHLLIETRLSAAYRTIKNHKDKIRVSEIAYSVGFNDAKYFSKQFKLKYGVTPRELAAERKNNSTKA